MIINGNSIAWLRPSTWPWVVYVWIAFALAGSLQNLWRWLQRKRAVEWPVASGRVDSADVIKPGFSLFSKRVPVRVELSYSYAGDGTSFSGKVKRDFYTEDEAEEFARALEGQSVTIHINPRNLAQSALLETDIDALPQNCVKRKPTKPNVNLFPAWSRPMLLFFAVLSCIGLILSLWVHLGALMGRRVAPEAFFWGLHVGIFVVWFPAVLVSQRLVGFVNRRDFWKVVLRGCPGWVRYIVYGFFGYAVLNFVLFIGQTPTGKGNSNPPAIVWRGFSGHWMAFYSAAFAILYSSMELSRNGGHFSDGEPIDPYLERCGRCGKVPGECNCYTFSR